MEKYSAFGFIFHLVEEVGRDVFLVEETVVASVGFDFGVDEIVQVWWMLVFDDVQLGYLAFSGSAGTAGSLNVGRFGSLSGSIKDMVDLVGVDAGGEKIGDDSRFDFSGQQALNKVLLDLMSEFRVLGLIAPLGVQDNR